MNELTYETTDLGALILIERDRSLLFYYVS